MQNGCVLQNVSYCWRDRVRQEARRTRGELSFLAGLVLSSSQTPLVGREDVQLSERAVELDWSVKLVAEETIRLRLDVGLLPHT